MSQIKVGDKVVFTPSKFFPNDPIEVGTVVAREKTRNHMFSYTILWGDGTKNLIPGYMMDHGQYNVFSNQKKALAFILSNSK